MEFRFLSSPKDWERVPGSLPERLHFKEPILKVLEATVLGSRFISGRTEKGLKIARFLK